MKITELKIFTQNLTNQFKFYSEILGLDMIDCSDEKMTFQIGSSRIQLVKSNRFKPYHFAINIPNNKETEALKWLKDRVEILKDGKSEIQDFDFWNAKAIYFYDADKNIVEFIARKNMQNESDQDFSVKSLLEISEIGMPVNDIEPIFKSLNKITDIEMFDGGFERFCAIGDENGLFICINKHLKDWFPTGDSAYSSDFEIKIIEQGREYELEFRNQVIKNKD